MAVGQFFSQRFGYAVHTLAIMGKKRYGEIFTLPQLVELLQQVWPGGPTTYLSNVMQRLARANIVRSHRGIAGGYSLARPAEEITLRHLVERLEGVDLDRCGLSLEGECPIVGRCGIQARLRKLEFDYLKQLDGVTIAQLSKELHLGRKAAN
jgi:Rrf2 family protein